MSAYDRLRTTVLARLADRDLAADDNDGLRRLIEDEIDRYQRGAYGETGDAGDPLTDPEAVRDRLIRSIRGRGPLDAALAKPAARHIRELRGVDDELFAVMDDGTAEAIDEPFSAAEMLEALQGLVTAAGGPALDEAHPGIGGLRVFLPDGRQARLSLSIYPRIEGTVSFVMRIFAHRNMHFDDWVRLDSMTAPSAAMMGVVALTDTSVLIAGKPGSGKTTFTDSMVRAGGDTRTLVLEEQPELMAPLIDGEKWHVNPAEDMAKLVIQLLTASPERCILTEFKGPEAWSLTRLANIGCGLWVSVHANSAADAIKALAFAAKAAPEAANVTVFELQERFAELLEVVVYLAKESKYSARANNRQPLQRVMEIAVQSPEVSPRGISLQPIFTRGGDIEAPLRWTEAELPPTLQYKFDEILRHQGLRSIDILRGAPVRL